MFKIVDNINNIYLSTTAPEMPSYVLSSGWRKAQTRSGVNIWIFLRDWYPKDKFSMENCGFTFFQVSDFEIQILYFKVDISSEVFLEICF